MKWAQKLMKLLAVVIVSMLLTACSQKVDGTYTGEFSGEQYTLVLDGEQAVLKVKSMWGEFDYEGTIDRKERQITVIGSVYGIESKQEGTYEELDSDRLLLETKDGVLLLKKEEK